MLTIFKDKPFRGPQDYYQCLHDLASVDFSCLISSLAPSFAAKCCNLPKILAVPQTHSVPFLELLHFLESPLPLLTNSYSFVKIQTNCCFSKAPKPLLRHESLPTHHLFPSAWDGDDYYREDLKIIIREAQKIYISPYFLQSWKTKREVVYPRSCNKLPAELRLKAKNGFSLLWDLLMPTRPSLGLDPILCS